MNTAAKVAAAAPLILALAFLARRWWVIYRDGRDPFRGREE